jgi:hypothetical protein
MFDGRFEKYFGVMTVMGSTRQTVTEKDPVLDLSQFVWILDTLAEIPRQHHHQRHNNNNMSYHNNNRIGNWQPKKARYGDYQPFQHQPPPQQLQQHHGTWWNRSFQFEQPHQSYHPNKYNSNNNNNNNHYARAAYHCDDEFAPNYQNRPGVGRNFSARHCNDNNHRERNHDVAHRATKNGGHQAPNRDSHSNTQNYAKRVEFQNKTACNNNDGNKSQGGNGCGVSTSHQSKIECMPKKSKVMLKVEQTNDEATLDTSPQQEPPKEGSDQARLKSFITSYKSFWSLCHTSLGMTSGTPVENIIFKVDPKCKLQELFENWYRKSECVFRDTINVVKTRTLAQQLLMVSEVELSGKLVFSSCTSAAKQLNSYCCCDMTDEKEPRRLKDKVKEKLEAVDAGGVSREFFSQVWHQMGSLQVRWGKVTINLFEEISEAGCEPISDMTIKGALENVSQETKDLIQEKINAFYRAIGRLMIHWLATDPLVSYEKFDDEEASMQCGHSIAVSALPAIYRNGLFLQHCRD